MGRVAMAVEKTARAHIRIERDAKIEILRLLKDQVQTNRMDCAPADDQ